MISSNIVRPHFMTTHDTLSGCDIILMLSQDIFVSTREERGI